MSGKLKEVRERMKSVSSTQQITKAMKMVSAAKLRKAQDAIVRMRPYADKLNYILRNVLSAVEGDVSINFGKERPVQHATMVTDGKTVFGSSGDFGPAFMMGVGLEDQRVHWRDRGFAKANLLRADGKLIILDEDGNLALATADEKGLNVLSKCKPLEEKAWTVPTLVGANLYLRDNKRLIAMDISAAANK